MSIEELYAAIQIGFDLLDKRLLMIEAMATVLDDGDQQKSLLDDLTEIIKLT